MQIAFELVKFGQAWPSRRASGRVGARGPGGRYAERIIVSSILNRDGA